MKLYPTVHLSWLRMVLLGVAIAWLLRGGILAAEKFASRFDAEKLWLGLADEWRTLILGFLGILAFTVIFYVLPSLSEYLTRWGKRQQIVLADVVVTSLAVFLMASAFYEGLELSARRVEWALSVALLVTLGIRLARTPRAKVPVTPQTLFDEVLGPGLAAIEDASLDELERGGFVSALFDLVAHRRESSLNFGLEGPWGSGKTSILNLLRKRLDEAGYAVVSLDLWSYREPDRLVRAYFSHLEEALGEAARLSGARRSLLRLGMGLADIGEGWVSKILKLGLSKIDHDSVESIREELRVRLREQDRPVVILVDDLDRLEAEELQAVLRAIRLVSDLPNLVHVLAYDRRQLSLALFPEDKEGERARDYLGKIINVEMAIGAPSEELAARLLERSLKPLLEAVGHSVAESFRARLQSQPIAVLTEALQTPREIRRVAAAAAWKWERMRRELNLFDLFVLEIIHYRFPWMYSQMMARPEWFTKVEWGNNPWVIALRKDWQEEAKSLRESLANSARREDMILLKLLSSITAITENSSSGSWGSVSLEDARKERRLIHPQNYSRYFYLYMPAWLVSEAEIEDFQEQVLAAEAGAERQELIRSRLVGEVAKERIESFWEQWGLAFEPEKVQGEEVIRDLVLGIARASSALSDRSGFLSLSPMKSGAFKVMELVAQMGTDEVANGTLDSVVRESPSVGFVGYLLRYAEREDKRLYGERKIDAQKLSRVLDKVVEERYLGERFLLEEPRAYLSGALIGGCDGEVLLGILRRELRRKPILLPALIRHAAPYTLGDREEPVFEEFNPDWLNGRVRLDPIYDATISVPLDAWQDPIERELVRRFREWIEERRAR